MLDLCAARPGKAVGYADVVDATGRDRNVLRADLASLTVMVKKRFGRANWPVEREWSAEAGEAYYSMSHQQSQAWIAATTPENPLSTDSSSTVDT